MRGAIQRGIDEGERQPTLPDLFARLLSSFVTAELHRNG